MIDMSMVYCWLNLQHQQKQSGVLHHIIYICIPQYVFDHFFWLLWPLFHELHKYVVLLEDWMMIGFLYFLLPSGSSLDPVDSPNFYILCLLSQNCYQCMKTTLWEYLFDLQFSKMPLKMNQHPSWMTSPNVLHMSSDKWTSKCIVLLFLYFSLVLWWMVWHNQQQH